VVANENLSVVEAPSSRVSVVDAVPSPSTETVWVVS
jgi:hypothetical protein